jgi:predicted glycoside hydrolase/deacetylase ChbG (UPF0249 family)
LVDFTRRNVFAADDWGFSPGINAGILELAKRGWLATVSCVANSPYLTHRLDELLDCLKFGTKVSLHLNLTYGKPLLAAERVGSLCGPDGHFFSHHELMRRCFSLRLRGEEVKAEFQAQIQELRRHLIPVTGLDGHHHVHLLPCVIRSLNDAPAREGLSEIRLMSDYEHPWSYLQTLVFKAFQARGSSLRRERCFYLRPRHLRTLTSFRRKLSQARGVPLLVHPALYNDFQSSGMMDDLRDVRVEELKKILHYLNE